MEPHAMRTRTTILVATVVGLLMFVVWREYSSAQGEPAKPRAATNRYQISSWGSATLVGGKMQVGCGAYIVDSESGDVYFVTNEDVPRLLGAVKKP